MSRLRLGLPSKGRLQDQAADWLAARGLVVTRNGSERTYAGEIAGLDGLDPVLVSAGEIPRELAEGRLDLGITGLDVMTERVPGWQTRLRRLAPLGFGHADLVVAVPQAWVDVETMDDVDAVAAAFRARHGMRLRVATKYHTLVRAFFRDHGIADYCIVDSQGATEAAVANQTAEMIVDITSSGETLRANHLKILGDGLILASEATLFLTEAAARDPEKAEILRRFLTQTDLSGARKE
ncbi:MAG: ATP phosphoribosyltransferase [Pseudomonadota bacterium]